MSDGFSADANYRAFQAAPREFKSKFFDNLRAYTKHIVQYIKREKLSGQVLGKYRGAYDAGGGWGRGQAKWRVKPGTLKKTFGANAYNSPPAIQFMETIYGAAWEEGFVTPEMDIVPTPGRKAGKPPATWKARLMFYWNGRWCFARKVHIERRENEPKPHIRPAIGETKRQLELLIWRPFMKFMTGGIR